MTYRRGWSGVVSCLAVTSVLLALVMGDPMSVVLGLAATFVIAVGVLVALKHDDPPSRIDWPEVRWQAALAACVCMGFPPAVVAFQGAALVLLMALLLCSPPVVARVRSALAWESDRVTRLLDAGPTPEVVATLDTATLCVAWRRSFLMLSAASTSSERALVADLRQCYLDELTSRHPASVERWLATEPQPSSGPERFLPSAHDEDAA